MGIADDNSFKWLCFNMKQRNSWQKMGGAEVFVVLRWERLHHVCVSMQLLNEEEEDDAGGKVRELQK